MENEYIGLMVEDTGTLLTGLWGILKSGNCLVPINPAIPFDRLCFIVEDCRVKILLTDRVNYARAQQAVQTCSSLEHVICIDDIDFEKEIPGRSQEITASAPQVSRQQLHPGYVIYTSGSTGKPKGVPITYTNLVPLLLWFHDYFKLGNHTRVLQNLSYTFDFGFFELVTTLLTGGTLYFFNKQALSNINEYVDFIYRHQLNTIHTTPSFFTTIIGLGKELSPVKLLHFGGERLTGKIVREVSRQVDEHCYIYNGYGPTETTINSAIFSIRADAASRGRVPDSIPIGKPSANNSIYILDHYRNLQPVGVVGELYIGGSSVAGGYINRPELTAEKFTNLEIAVKDEDYPYGQAINIFGAVAPPELHELPQIGPTSNKKLLQGVQGGGFLEKSPPGRRRQKKYKTGDLGKWLPDGDIEFLGRIDHQVKIRGFRIELGEIESRLLKCSGITDAVVIDLDKKTGGASPFWGGSEDKYLCAYVVSKHHYDGTPTHELREELARHLPDYMIPGYFVILDKIPLTPNGKLDRRALPVPEITGSRDYTAPRNEAEKTLVEIWSQLLGVDPNHIGIDDNFFELGGHSLKVTSLLGRVHQLFDVEISFSELFKVPTVRGISHFIMEASRRSHRPIDLTENRTYYPLTATQKRFYVFQQLEPANMSYNMPEIMLMQGQLAREKFAKAFKQLLLRHESLRTSFHLRGGEPVQRIHESEKVGFALEYYDLIGSDPVGSGLPSPLKAEDIINNFVRPFNLNQPPLWRVGLVKTGPDTHYFMFDMHHIISDGVSIGIFTRDFLTIYKAEPLPSLKIRHRDYALWLQKGRERSAGISHATPGREEPEDEVLDLPTDYVRPAVPSHDGRTLAFNLDNDVTGALYHLSLQRGVTLYMIILAAYNILFAKLSGQENIAIGSPIAGRTHVDLENVLGLFLNILCLKNQPKDEKRFSEFLTEIKENTINAFENQEYLYDELLEKAKQARSSGRNPLFDAMFVLQNMDMPEIEIPGLEVTREMGESRTSKFDMTLYCEEKDTLVFRLEYSTQLFKQETILRFIKYFKKIISEILENPHQKIAGIEIISDREKQQVLYDFNDTAVLYPKDRTIYQVLEEQAEKTPGNIALTVMDKEDAGTVSQEMTYRELNQTGNQMAHLLREKGVNRGTVIGIMLERSPEMLTGIQAILKAGGAYLPIDPEYPDNRIVRMLEESGASMVLTGSKIYEKRNLSCLSPKQEFLLVDELAETLSSHPGEKLLPVSGPNDLIYIIFTSGSTGKPKGAGVYHRGFMNLMHWFVSEFELQAQDSNLLLTSLSFDLTQKNLYAPLMRGGTLCIPGINYFEPRAILRQIQRNHVSWINCTPSMFYKLVEHEKNREEKRLTSLRYVFLGGEPIAMPLLIDWLESAACQAQIVNTYGPTECTDICASFRIREPRRCLEEPIPVGQPVYNVQLFVLGKNLQLVPVGVPGELFIGGEGVGIGYVNDRESTSCKFISHRFAPGEPQQLLYRTGDLVKWLANGLVEFLGRIDHQVKVRGFRIELGEIENRLSTHKNVKETIVIAKEGDGRDNYLCAYIIPHERATFREQELRDYLAEELPDYMVPAYFVPLEKMPLNPNGKVDRKALPEPDPTAGANRMYVPPANEIESILVKIWAEVLGQDKKRIGVHDNFFQLGGHSLKAASLISRIHKAFSVEIPIVELFKIPTVRAIGSYIDKTVESIYPPIKPVEKKEYYPLSSAQKRLYVLQQIEGAGTSYNIPLVLIVAGILDRTKPEETFKKLISHHESLRTSFAMIDMEPVQQIHDRVAFEIEYYKVEVEAGDTGGTRGPTPLPYAPWPKEPAAALISSFIRPFDLSKAPLLRVGLVKTGQDEHLLMVDIHHIVSDGISTDIFIRDFTALYAGEKLPGRMVQYKDFSGWQQGQKEKGSLQEQERYWLKEFADEIPVLHLPTDFPRPVIQDFAGNSLSFEIEKKVTGKLKDLALTEEVTLYMVLSTIFNIFLARISTQEDIVVGTAVAGRKQPELEKIIGMFVNTLVLRNFPQGDKTVKEFLTETGTRTLQAQENQDYPFEDLVEKAAANIKRDAGRNPLFDVMFVLQNMHISEINIPGLKLTPYNYETQAAKFDFTFICEENEREGIIHFTIEYSTTLFKKETIQRWSHYFKNILAAAVDTPGKKIGELEFIPEEEKHRVLVDFNKTDSEYPADKTIPELFAGQVERTPDHIAVVGPPQVKYRSYMTDMTGITAMTYISYRELNERSNHLAHLLQNENVKPDTGVGIMVKRSIEMIIGILGILKAGAAYLPIDPDYPEERINYMLKDSNAGILLKRSSFGAEKSGTIPHDQNVNDKNSTATCLVLKFEHLKFEFAANFEFRAANLNPANLAYIIYTSGSTGRPKGVAVGHRNVVRLIKNTNYIQFKENDRLLQTGALEFDASTFEIWGSLLNGMTLYITTIDKILSPAALGEIIRKYSIHTLWLTSPLFNQLTGENAGIFAGVRNLLVGGDVLSPVHIDKVRKKFPALNIMNGYGPTENTTFSTIFLIKQEYQERIPIGQPIANSTAYILDKFDKPVPIGVTGELWVGGHGVSRGYLNNPELTAEHFCLRQPGALFEKTAPGPHKNFLLKEIGKRYHRSHMSRMSYSSHRSYIYKTGDLARWLHDGNIEFLGRIDQQVKIRGFRIEPGEIENRLLDHGNIKEAIVITKENSQGDKYICAYIVAAMKPGSPPGLKVPGLREYLIERLPDYMVPSYFVTLDKIPLTTNGKIDWQALPEPVSRTEEKYAAPGDEVERILVEIWTGLLGIDARHSAIGIDDNFFQLGGHSLKATILVSKIHQAFDVQLPLGEFFKNPTIRKLSKYIKTLAPHKFAAIKAVEKKEYYGLSAAQKRLYILDQMEPGSTGYNITGVFLVEAELDPARWENMFRELINRHESFRTSFLTVAEEPVQRIHEALDFEIHRFDFKINQVEAKAGDTEETRALAPLSHAPLPPGPTIHTPQPTAALISSFIRPFDLSRAPLLRVGIMPGENKKYLLIVDMHHIIADGLSIVILQKEIHTLYNLEKLPPLRIQAKDYPHWQKGELNKGKLQQQGAYWLKEFAEEIPVLNLPYDYARPPVQGFAGSCLNFDLELPATNALKNLASQESCTLFMVLLASHNILLAKLSSQEDIVVGTPIAARRHADLEHVLGMFVNTLALRNRPNRDKTFIQFLKEIKENTLAAFENQDYPFEELVEQVVTNRDAGRNPLFDAMLAFQDWTTGEPANRHLEITPYEYENNTSKFDMTLGGGLQNERLHFTLEYSTKLFNRETILRFTRYFKQIISIILENPHQKIAAIEIASEEEKRRILVDFNATAVEFPADKTIPELFAGQVERTPDHIAVVGPPQVKYRSYMTDMTDMTGMTGMTYISYRELNEKSNQLAYLLNEKGVQTDIIVGIMAERSLAMVIGLLSILKAGAAYLPLDPEYPEERINYILTDAKVNVLVKNSNIFTDFAAANNVDVIVIDDVIDKNPPRTVPIPTSPLLPCYPAGPAGLAYILYTSGSTGKPKGVLLGHRSILNVLTALQKQYPLKKSQTYLFKTSYLFDVSVTELFGWFWEGGRLTLLEKNGEKDPRRIMDTIENECVTHINFVPPMFNLFIDFLNPGNIHRLSGLKYIFLAGEALLPGPVEKFRQLAPDIALENLYGPTEATIYASYYSLSQWDGRAGIPIGKPLANIGLYILDPGDCLQPPGVVGELCIGGLGLARGYLNQPELTAERFCLQQPGALFEKTAPGPRKNFLLMELMEIDKRYHRSHMSYSSHRSYIYKTGDLARWLHDGNIEFLGRMDHQVKIRGFRIELGEIEKQLLHYRQVKEAVVIARESQGNNSTAGDQMDRYLCAYITAGKELTVPGLREYLSRTLPGYMIPSYFVIIDKLPLTPSGKLDRKSLPEPVQEAGPGYIAPRDEVEEKLAAIWTGVLGRGEALNLSPGQSPISPGIDDNFFQLGGHSLKATLMISKIHKTFNVQLPLGEFFKNPTIRKLSKYIKTLAPHKFATIKAVEKKEYFKLSSAQKRLYVLQQMHPESNAYNMPMFFTLPGEYDVEKLENILKELINYHESLRTSFHMVKNEMVQKIHDEVNFTIENYQAAVGEKVEDIVKTFIQPFDLTRAPLIKVGLLESHDGQNILMTDMHHIISDGVSQEILAQDFQALTRGTTSPPLKIQYKDYSEWQNRHEEKNNIKQQETYWLNEFKGEIPLLNMPTDYQRPEVLGFTGDSVHLDIAQPLTQQIKKLAARLEVTLMMFLLSVYKILLARYSGQEELVVGTVIAGRPHPDLENIIGFFVNMLPIKTRHEKNQKFSDYVRELKEKALNAFENQEYPFEEMVNKLGIQRQPGRHSLVDVVFVFMDETYRAAENRNPGKKSDILDPRKVSHFDLMLHVTDRKDSIGLLFEYSTALYKVSTVKKFANSYVEILEQLLENPDSILEEINISLNLLTSTSNVIQNDNDEWDF